MEKKKTNQQKVSEFWEQKKSDCESKWVAKQAAWLACRMCLYLCTFVFFFLHPFVMCLTYLPSAINKLAAHWVYISYLIAYVWFHFKRDFVEFRIVRSKGIGCNNWVCMWVLYSRYQFKWKLKSYCNRSKHLRTIQFCVGN